MDPLDIHARDPRVAAILIDPDRYFNRARRRAWLEAGIDIDADLDRRARRRRGRTAWRQTSEPAPRVAGPF